MSVSGIKRRTSQEEVNLSIELLDNVLAEYDEPEARWSAGDADGSFTQDIDNEVFTDDSSLETTCENQEGLTEISTFKNEEVKDSKTNYSDVKNRHSRYSNELKRPVPPPVPKRSPSTQLSVSSEKIPEAITNQKSNEIFPKEKLFNSTKTTCFMKNEDEEESVNISSPLFHKVNGVQSPSLVASDKIKLRPTLSNESTEIKKVVTLKESEEFNCVCNSRQTGYISGIDCRKQNSFSDLNDLEIKKDKQKLRDSFGEQSGSQHDADGITIDTVNILNNQVQYITSGTKITKMAVDKDRERDERFKRIRYLLQTGQIKGLDDKPPKFKPPPPPPLHNHLEHIAFNNRSHVVNDKDINISGKEQNSERLPQLKEPSTETGKHISNSVQFPTPPHAKEDRDHKSESDDDNQNLKTEAVIFLPRQISEDHEKNNSKLPNSSGVTSLGTFSSNSSKLLPNQRPQLHFPCSMEECLPEIKAIKRPSFKSSRSDNEPTKDSVHCVKTLPLDQSPSRNDSISNIGSNSSSNSNVSFVKKSSHSDIVSKPSFTPERLIPPGNPRVLPKAQTLPASTKRVPVLPVLYTDGSKTDDDIVSDSSPFWSWGSPHSTNSIPHEKPDKQQKKCKDRLWKSKKDKKKKNKENKDEKCDKVNKKDMLVTELENVIRKKYTPDPSSEDDDVQL